MAFLKVKNRAVSTLDSGISDSDLSLTVASGEGALFPSTYPFHITIEDEILECTSRSTDVLTVTRAAEGTAAAAHTADKSVELRITAAIITEMQKEIQDADGDTGWEAEQSADEDILRGKVAGVEAVHVSAIGVQTLVKQSNARGWPTNDVQMIPSGAWTKVVLDSEDYDIQDELDITRKVGTADDTEANKLHDADGGFASGDVGAEIWNTTDNTYATVTAFVDSGELTLDADIMVDTETYVLFHSRFTATEDGIYFVNGSVYFASPVTDSYVSVGLYKNGANAAIARYHTSSTGVITPGIGTFLQLVATDYIELFAYHNCGGDEQMYAGTNNAIFLAISKVA